MALGGLVGIAGALALSRLAGPPPGRLRLGWLAASAVSVVVLFHGGHPDAEPRIHLAAYALHICGGR
ncbi:MAG: hypothetical protein ABI369_05370 [Acetobacteraceae bacterium]